jgi:asparagine synthase (glutamine-hydrolysing)
MAEAQLCQMVQAICHESFYKTGMWIDEAAGIYVGWAVLAGSACDCLPVRSEDGGVTLIFSGQNYSSDDVRIARVLELYEEAANFPAALNGLFHGLIADRRRGVALLFNDRYGMHRLCYHESGNDLYFAAEAKAILAVLPELREPDPKSLGEFVACSCVLEDRTLFRRIQAMPAGSVWTIENGAVTRKQTYFQPAEWEQLEAGDPETFYEHLRGALARTLPRYFAGSERTGVALTGGLDTRVIMAWHKAEPGALPCYTFGGMFRDCHDVKVARKVAEVCGQSHQVIPVGKDFLGKFARYADRTLYMTEGGVDVYRAPDLYVSEIARTIAPAKVVGTYGSEIVRRAVMFKPAIPVQGLFRPELLQQIDTARQTYSRLRQQHPVTFAAFRQSPWYHQGVLALEQTQLTVRSPFLDNDFVRTVYLASSAAISDGDVRLRLIHDGSLDLARIPSDRGVGGSRNPAAAMLSRAILEFTFKADYAFDYGMPQWLIPADRMLSQLHWERMFLGRHKFSHFRVWYRDWLGSYLRDVLLDTRSLQRPYVNGPLQAQLVNDHITGRRNCTTAIHKLLALELLHRNFFDPR